MAIVEEFACAVGEPSVSLRMPVEKETPVTATLLPAHAAAERLTPVASSKFAAVVPSVSSMTMREVVSSEIFTY